MCTVTDILSLQKDISATSAKCFPWKAFSRDLPIAEEIRNRDIALTTIAISLLNALQVLENIQQG